jgi:hypothetical protein
MLADSWVTPGRIYFRRVVCAASFWIGELALVPRGGSGGLRFEGVRHVKDRTLKTRECGTQESSTAAQSVELVR